MTSQFGRIIHAGQVEHAVQVQLVKWMSTYLAELERQNELEVGKIARPKSWNVLYAYERWPEEQIPSVSIVATRLHEEPDRFTGFGDHKAWWRFDIVSFVTARSEHRARELAQIYTAAARTIMLQKGTCEGFGEANVWMDEGWDAGPIPNQRSRSMGVGVTTHRILVPDVATALAGPTGPDALPDPLEEYPDLPIIDTVELDVINVPVNEEIDRSG
jgi:hypothetical protein